MSKPFLTIPQQVDLMRYRGVDADDYTAAILAREGYYSVVNGYKDPFLDREASRAAGDDRYTSGTRFTDIYDLFSFDRTLRMLTFAPLVRAEATCRTAIAYCFSDRHRNPDDYLLQSSYCTKEEYEAYKRGGKPYAKELSGLTGDLSRKLHRSRSDFVAHYMIAHGSVPLWVLCNELTFGNLEHFFNLMKPGEREDVCRMIATSTGRLGDRRMGFFSVEEARVSLEVLVEFRNICAHDERLYCARVGGRKNINYDEMVWRLERFMTQEDFYGFLADLFDLIISGMRKNPKIEAVLGPLGFESLVDKLNDRRMTPESEADA